MTLRNASVFVLTAVLWMAAGSVLAQDFPDEPETDANAPAATESAATGSATTGTTSVDEILAGEEEVLAGSSYSYDPGNRRDPFRSLLAAKDRVQRKGPLPEGIPGLMIEEIDLTGIFHTNRGFVAQVLASNKEKSYLIREGDELYDGDVVSITQNEVVFKQIVNDPTVIKPFREVVKKLTP